MSEFIKKSFTSFLDTLFKTSFLGLLMNFYTYTIEVRYKERWFNEFSSLTNIICIVKKKNTISHKFYLANFQ